MTTKTEKHIHKFKRHKYKSGAVTFFCALPDCTAKMAPALALSKRSLCWRCGEPFVMTEYSLRLAKPHCESCHKPKKSNLVEVGPGILVDPLLSEPHPTGLSLSERLQQTLQKVTLPPEIEDEI